MSALDVLSSALTLAFEVCTVLGETVQVSHSSEEVLALKKEIARCQVEADKLRTAISLNKVYSSIQAANALPQPFPAFALQTTPPPPPCLLTLPLHALLDLWSVAWQAFAPGLASKQRQHVWVSQSVHSACKPAHYEKQSA